MFTVVKYFKSLPLKELLAHLLFSFAVVLNAISALFDLTYERYSFAIVQSSAVVINSLLLVHYLKYRNLRFATFGLSIVYSVEMQLIMYFEEFALYSYFFPLFLPLIAYLTLSLKESTIMTLLHYTSVIILSLYAYFVWQVESEMFQASVVYGYMLSACFIILFGLFYHLTIVDAYYKLFENNLKHELALGEIHHRLRNNLSLISSMFGMQMHRHDKEDIQSLIDKNRTRIETIASIQDTLYREGQKEEITFERYIDELIDHLLSLSELPIKVKMKIDKLYFNAQVMQQLGSIIHELVTNSLKYAFDPKNNNMIELTFHLKEDKLYFTYRDNGKGCEREKLDQSHSLGSELIKLTVKELGGEISFENNGGFICHITLPSSHLLGS
ncbi:sensor histidine kinase [Sulfurovum mangrovi]|uniref:sensor histidine kinase n=1 Tax=Sulfurovum mangrovi TaxID=2893889 RepID=UPI001E44AB5E|nr:sensor histidine kinase [Sulfurovum mangrovi]UFH60131.1 sensor histidine kinase [Sulfurovum mangrovi]